MLPKNLQTSRLKLRELNTEDAAFILELVNEPAWLRFIGDRGIRTLEAARDHILKVHVETYARLGFGLWLVELLGERTPVGVCGLLKRETLVDIDLGFAFLAAHRKKGYAFEAASSALGYARSMLDVSRIVAIASPENEDSPPLAGKTRLRLREDDPSFGRSAGSEDVRCCAPRTYPPDDRLSTVP